eukprot:277869-Prorocentrum_minimum.AAC.1
MIDGRGRIAARGCAASATPNKGLSNDRRPRIKVYREWIQAPRGWIQEPRGGIQEPRCEKVGFEPGTSQLEPQ